MVAEKTIETASLASPAINQPKKLSKQEAKDAVRNAKKERASLRAALLKHLRPLPSESDSQTSLMSRLPLIVQAVTDWVRQPWTQNSDPKKEQPAHLNIVSNVRYTRYGEAAYLRSLKESLRATNADGSVDISMLSRQEMDIKTFGFVLNQLPTVRHVTFAGRGEPLLNPDLMSMIDFASSERQAYTKVVTNGLLLDQYMLPLVQSDLNELQVNLMAHRPTMFQETTGQDARNFADAYQNLKTLMTLKKKRKLDLKITLMMVVTAQNFQQVPKMIDFAAELGVDKLLLEHYTSANTDDRNYRTLYRDTPKAGQMWLRIKRNMASYFNLEIELPKLMKRENKIAKPLNRNCTDAFESITVDGECRVWACSQQNVLPTRGELGKVWDDNVWNGQTFKELRHAHGGQFIARETCLPEACKFCPKNCG